MNSIRASNATPRPRSAAAQRVPEPNRGALSHSGPVPPPGDTAGRGAATTSRARSGTAVGSSYGPPRRTPEELADAAAAAGVQNHQQQQQQQHADLSSRLYMTSQTAPKPPPTGNIVSLPGATRTPSDSIGASTTGRPGTSLGPSTLAASAGPAPHTGAGPVSLRPTPKERHAAVYAKLSSRVPVAPAFRPLSAVEMKERVSSRATTAQAAVSRHGRREELSCSPQRRGAAGSSERAASPARIFRTQGAVLLDAVIDAANEDGAGPDSFLRHIRAEWLVPTSSSHPAANVDGAATQQHASESRFSSDVAAPHLRQGAAAVDALLRQQRDADDGAFLYLTYADATNPSPYDLVVVDPGRVAAYRMPSAYFTGSAAGVTVFGSAQGGGAMTMTTADTEITPMLRWTHEWLLHRRMRKLHFLPLARKWRLFADWRRAVKSARNAASGSAVESSLPMMDPVLRPALERVRLWCSSLEGKPLAVPSTVRRAHERTLSAEDQQTSTFGAGPTLQATSPWVTGLIPAVTLHRFIPELVTLDRYISLQREAQRRGAEAIMKVHHVLAEALEAAYTTLARDRGSGELAELEEDAPTPCGGNNHRRPRRQTTGLTFTEQSRRKKLARRYTSFLRLADMHLVRALVSVVLRSIHSFVKEVLEAEAGGATSSAAAGASMPRSARAPVPPSASQSGARPGSASARHGGASTRSPPPAPVGNMASASSSSPTAATLQLHVTLCLDPDSAGLVLSLKRHDAVGCADAVLNGILDAARRIPRTTEIKELKPVVALALEGLSEEEREAFATVDFDSLLRSLPEYREAAREVRDVANTQYEAVVAHADSFTPVTDIYTRNRRVDAAYVRRTAITAEDFRNAIDEVRADIETVESKPLHRRVGPFAVDATELHAVVAPVPKRALQLYLAILPLYAREQNQHLLDELSDLVSGLQKKPASVRDFSAYVSHHSRAQQRLGEVELAFEAVRDLYVAISFESEIELPAEDDIAYSHGTVRQVSLLKELLAAHEEQQDHMVARFAEDIQRTFRDIEAETAKLLGEITDPFFDSVDTDATLAIERLEDIEAQIRAQQEIEAEHLRYQVQFNLDPLPVEELAETAKLCGEKLRMWRGLADWEIFLAELKQTPVALLDTKVLRDAGTRFARIVTVASRALSDAAVVQHFKAQTSVLRQYIPVADAIRNPHLDASHMRKMDQILQMKLVPGATGVPSLHGRTVFEAEHELLFGTLIDLHVADMVDELTDVSQMATQEHKIDAELRDIQAVWQGGNGRKRFDFVLAHHKEVAIVGPNLEEVVATVEETLVRVTALSANRYCEGPLRARAERLEMEIRIVSSTVDRWIAFQQLWLYLYNVFGQPEIARQWPTDEKLYRGVDTWFRDLMRRVADMPGIFHNTALAKKNEEFFATHIGTLERVMASLEEKLELKRRAFPRFYFLSNDDLIDTLAQVKHPERVQPHLPKLFDNVKSLVMSSDTISGIVSSEGERLNFERSRNVKARGDAERWLEALRERMCDTVKARIAGALERHVDLFSVDTSLDAFATWLFAHPAQAVLLCIQILWAANIESALGVESDVCKRDSAWGYGVPDVAHLLQARHKATVLALDRLAQLTSRDLSPIERVALTTVITQTVHMRDVTKSLIDQKVRAPSDFGWQMRLRAVWSAKLRDATFHQGNHVLDYGYEYIGAQPRLVITPMTDRIVLTITLALRHRLGAAPSGPAGTGKTETVKDLARNTARHCIVFNCSDGVTYHTMARLWSGLVQCGSWSCLDEFNRISIEVLSVIASQLMEIQNALLSRQEDFCFNGSADRIPCLDSFGAFITQNPGYAGRTELPDNLKSLFRPVAVMVPEFRMIAEVILFSEGFTSALVLSGKVTQLYALSAEQLSPQDHYDFGMRALKSVLQMAGSLKRGAGDCDETITLLRACTGTNLPKLVAADVPLFLGIVADLFPGVDTTPAPREALTATIPVAAVEDCGYAFTEGLASRCVQLYETLIVRFGVMLVGGAGGGKSAARTTLRATLNRLYDSRATLDRRLQELEQADESDPAVAAARDSRASLAGFSPEQNARMAELQRVISAQEAVDATEFTDRPTSHYEVNPKAVTYAELYGAVSAASGEWTDGVFVSIVKRLMKDLEQRAQRDATVSAARQAKDTTGATPTNTKKAAATTTTADNRGDSEFCGSDYTWLVFDGPVDTLWIESLNSVLDDSRLLCLDNGVRIRLPPHFRMLFETPDLSQASPATVSRCGMVYMDADDLDWHCIVDAHLESADFVAALGSEELREDLKDLILRVLPRILPVFAAEMPAFLRYSTPHAVTQLMRLLRATLEDHGEGMRLDRYVDGIGDADEMGSVGPGAAGKSGRKSFAAMAASQRAPMAGSGGSVLGAHRGRTAQWESVRMALAFACVWTFGANTNTEGAEVLDTLIRDSLAESIPLPSYGLVTDYCIDSTDDAKGGARWVRWETKVPAFKYNAAVAFGDQVVPTVDTERFGEVAAMMLRTGSPVLVAGGTGVGKSPIVRSCFGKLGSPASFYLPLSARTSAARVQDTLESKLALQRGRKEHLGPAHGDAAYFFVDDVQLPAPEAFGAVPALELLRQLIATGSMYDRKRCFSKSVEGTGYVATCSASEATGAAKICGRFTRHFHLLQAPSVTDASVKRIYESLLSAFMAQPCAAEGDAGFLNEVQALVPRCVGALAETFMECAHVFLPIPSRPHFSFNLRDVSKCVEGLTRATPSRVPDVKSFTSLYLHEVVRGFADRLVTDSERTTFEELASDCMRRNGLTAFGFNAEQIFGPKQSDGWGMLWGDFGQPGGRGGAAMSPPGAGPARQGAYARIVNVAALPEHFEALQGEIGSIPREPAGVAGGLAALIYGAGQLNAVVFPSVASHLCRVLRVLKQPRGNMLLIGLPGGGKRTIARLACAVASVRCAQLVVGNSFKMDHFRECLGELYTVAGVEQTAVALVINDTDIVDEGMLEDINSVLGSADVPGLFSHDDREKLIQSTIESARGGSTVTSSSSREDVYQVFLSRVRAALHVVLCLSPAGDSLRRRCRQFPSIVNACAVDWVDRWPTDALVAVGRRCLAEGAAASDEAEKKAADAEEQSKPKTAADIAAERMAAKAQSDTDAAKKVSTKIHAATQQQKRAEDWDRLADVAARIHHAAAEVAEDVTERRGEYRSAPGAATAVYLTPATYLEYLRSHNALCAEKRADLLRLQMRAARGIAKMAEAQESVAGMEQKIRDMEPALQVKRSKLEELMHDLNTRKVSAEQVALVVEGQRSIAAEEAQVAQDIKADAEADLARAQPELLDALRSLKALQKSDIDEIKKYSVPPKAVMLTIEAVLTLLHEKKPSDWGFAKTVLGGSRFIERLYNFRVESLDDGVINRMQKFIRDPDFVPDKVGTSGSEACRSLCKWTIAMEHYYHVHKKVEPKRTALVHAERTAAVARAGLDDAEGKLKSAQAQLQTLEDFVNVGKKELHTLEEEVERCRKRLVAAKQLTDCLGGESDRWGALVEERGRDLALLRGTMLVAAAFAVYGGPFRGHVRRKLLHVWTKIVEHAGVPLALPAIDAAIMAGNDGRHPGRVDVMANLSAPMEIRSWSLASLPSDVTSIENAIIVTEASSRRSRRWPLAIDPQNQASAWLRRMHPDLKRIDASDPKLLQHMKGAVANGQRVLIEGVGASVDPALASLLQREVLLDHGVPVIELGGETVEYNQHFQLFLVTPAANPAFLPDVGVMSRIVDFTVTADGLSEQILAQVVAHEQAELEQKSTANVKAAADAHDRLDLMEQRVLELLDESAEGNILDNAGLIEELQQCRSLSGELADTLATHEAQRISLAQQRTVYQPVATRCALLYFSVASMALIDRMYAVSLASLQRIFGAVLRTKQHEQQHTPSSPRGGGARAAVDDDPVQARVAWLVKRITAVTLDDVMPMLFERHRVVLALHVAAASERATVPQSVTGNDWALFLRLERLVAGTTMRDQVEALLPPATLAPLPSNGTSTKATLKAEEENDEAPSMEREALDSECPAFLTQAGWERLTALELVIPGIFCGLRQSVLADAFHWGDWVSALRDRGSSAAGPPPALVCPSNRYGKRPEPEPFHIMCLTRALFPELTATSAVSYVSRVLGDAVLQSRPLDIAAAIDRSTPTVPLVIALEQGSDPVPQIRRIAAARGFKDMPTVSLGQGQEALALRAVRSGLINGQWVLLQNCHLSKSYATGELERITSAMAEHGRDTPTAPLRPTPSRKEAPPTAATASASASARSNPPATTEGEGATAAASPSGMMPAALVPHAHPDFRLILTTMRCDFLPLAVLQTAVRVTSEPPSGLRAHMLKAFADAPPGAGGFGEKEALTDGTNRATAYLALSYAIAALHGSVLGRRRFGPLGWNVAYEFSDVDRDISRSFVQKTLAEARERVPWDAIRYVVGEINYAGRVTDPVDRRVLGAVVRRLLSPSLLSVGGDGESSDFPRDSGLPRPSLAFGFNDYMKHVDKIAAGGSADDPPGAFGLHPTSSGESNRVRSSALMEAVITTAAVAAVATTAPSGSSDGGGGGGKSRGDAAADDAAAADPHEIAARDAEQCHASLPPEMLAAEAHPSVIDPNAPASSTNATTASPLTTFLLHEMGRMNRLISRMRSTLSELLRAIAGTVAMSDVAADVLESFVLGSVPKAWAAVAFSSNKPLTAWLADVHRRAAFIGRWLRSGEPSSFWLGGLFFPQGFLTAVLQRRARSIGCAVDALTFQHTVMPSAAAASGSAALSRSGDDLDPAAAGLDGSVSLEGPVVASRRATGAIVAHGLICEAFEWDRQSGVMVDALPGRLGSLRSALPPLLFQPVPIDADSVEDTDQRVALMTARQRAGFDCPVYRTTARAGVLSSLGTSTNFIANVRLPTAKGDDHWLLRGAALVTSLPE